MIRARFKCDGADARPVVWPIFHPYWITGYSCDGSAIVVAYADDEEQVRNWWPDAIDIECEAADGYVFSSCFQKHHWFVEAKGEPS